MSSIIHFTHPGNLLLLLIAIPLFLYPFYSRRRNVRTRRLALALRLATAVSLVLALSGLQIVRGKRNAAVVFVVDRSQSVAPVDRAGALENISRIASSLDPEDEAGIVVFGKNAVIEQQLQKRLKISEIQSSPESTATNISRGLNLASAMLAARPDYAKRIVLLSDGNQTSGDALREAAVSATLGMPIDVIPVATAAEFSGRKLFLQECSGPESVRLGEPFEIRVVVRGSLDSDVVLQINRDEAIVSEQRLKLSADPQIFKISERILAPGFHQYRVRVQDIDKTRSYDSDEGGMVVYAYGKTKVLHIADKPVAFLDQILRRQGFEVIASSSQSAPTTARDFSPYDAVILDDVPATAFSEDQMRAMTEHVERYAGGLIMTGGSGSFGPGGYSGTAIEKALPVEMALRNREKKPALALVLVLDKSGSMGMEQRKISKLDMAKEAVLRLSDLLTPQDNLGIIAFDRYPQEVMPLGRSIDRVSVNASLQTIAPGGGTSILPAVEMAYKWLDNIAAEKKHILLLSDGQADQAERKFLIERVAGSTIVFSTIGAGSDADRPLLQKLAASGHGRTYFTDTGMELPEIFKREGLLISGRWFIERSFRPRQISAHEMLQNLGKKEFPEMKGYVATTPKKLAELLLAADNEDPILACWRYGLGRTAVFVSDFASHWTLELVRWEHFAGMWTQMVRWTSRGAQSESMHSAVRLEDEEAVLTIDSYDADGVFSNFMRIDAQLEYPDATTGRLEMKQIASGQYESRFPLKGRGVYLFTVAANKGNAEGEKHLHFGFDFSKLSEDRQKFSDRLFLRGIAEKAGGTVITGPAEFPQTDQVSGYRDAWQLAAIIAMLLFLVDLGIGRSGNPIKREQ